MLHCGVQWHVVTDWKAMVAVTGISPPNCSEEKEPCPFCYIPKKKIREWCWDDYPKRKWGENTNLLLFPAPGMKMRVCVFHGRRIFVSWFLHVLFQYVPRHQKLPNGKTFVGTLHSLVPNFYFGVKDAYIPHEQVMPFIVDESQLMETFFQSWKHVDGPNAKFFERMWWQVRVLALGVQVDIGENFLIVAKQLQEAGKVCIEQASRFSAPWVHAFLKHVPTWPDVCTFRLHGFESSHKRAVKLSKHIFRGHDDTSYTTILRNMLIELGLVLMGFDRPCMSSIHVLM